MFKRVMLDIVIIFLLAGCKDNISDNSYNNLPAHRLTAIYQKYGYSGKGFDTLRFEYNHHSNNEVASTLYYFNYASNYYKEKSDYENAKRYADSMLIVLSKPEYEKMFYKERAQANINMADAYYYLKQYKACYYYYCLGSIEAGKIHDTALTEDLYTHLSMFFYEEGNYENAIYYYKQLLLNESRQVNRYDRLIKNQGTLDNIGIAFLREKKADSSIAYFNQAIQCINQASAISNTGQKDFCRLAIGVVYGNLAQAYVLAHWYDKAEAMYKQSIAITIQSHLESENALITQQHLAELYDAEEKMPAFYETLQYIKNGLDTIHNDHVAMQWNYLMNRYYAAVHKPADALTYLEQYLLLKDESAKTTKPLVESDIFGQMNLLQSKYETDMLKKNNQTKDDFLWIACMLITLVLTIALLCFTYFKKSKKSVRLLTALNDQIKQKKALLENALEELKKQNIEKQHILHVVAHDLRNPLSAIYALAGMAESEYENEEEAKEYLELIKGACVESNQLIGGILEIAENSGITYKYQPIEVNVLLSNSVQLLRIKAKEKKQHIHLITVQERLIIYADSDKITRVIGNIVTNAVKFSPSGSHIEVSAIASGSHHVIIQIKDNGIGIPEKFHDSVFKAFTEAKRIGTNGEKTFGLGLSISRQIVEKHNGRIWFESAENKGTTFFIEIPLFDESSQWNGAAPVKNQQVTSY